MSRRPSAGFTLIEVVVAVAVMALMTALAWRGIDRMVRTQDIVQMRADQVRTVQLGLAQWRADLDQMVELSHIDHWDWDGKVLRLTRQGASGDTVEVVAWTWRQDLDRPGSGDWLRWQSAPIVGMTPWRQAWAQAQQWGLRPTAALREREVSVLGLDGFQLFVHRGGAWSHPLSTGEHGPRPSDDTGELTRSPPDAVRLLIDLPSSAPLPGRITVDWVHPGHTGDLP